MSFNSILNAPITVNNEPLEYVNNLTYLGSLISKDNTAQKNIQARLGNARGAFARLNTVWKSRQYSTITKLRLYNSFVKPVLLYGSECWWVTNGNMNKISAFHNGWIRRTFVYSSLWRSPMKNFTREQRAIAWSLRPSGVISDGLDMSSEWTRTPEMDTTWQKKTRATKTTRRRTVIVEQKEMGLTWGEAQYTTNDRAKWKQIDDALCPTRDKEELDLVTNIYCHFWSI